MRCVASARVPDAFPRPSCSSSSSTGSMLSPVNNAIPVHWTVTTSKQGTSNTSMMRPGNFSHVQKMNRKLETPAGSFQFFLTGSSQSFLTGSAGDLLAHVITGRRRLLAARCFLLSACNGEVRFIKRCNKNAQRCSAMLSDRMVVLQCPLGFSWGNFPGQTATKQKTRFA